MITFINLITIAIHIPFTARLSLFILLSLFASFLTISCSNPVYAVLALISLFCLSCTYFIFLGIGFLGFTYLLINVGAIAILFLFVVMMLFFSFYPLHCLSPSLPLASLSVLLFLPSSFFDSFSFFYFPFSWPSLFNSSTCLSSFSFPLYSSFSLWFLLSSLVLFLAILAPILLIFYYPIL